MAVKVSLKVNGKPVSAEVEERTLLVTLIRENLRLTGTRHDRNRCDRDKSTSNRSERYIEGE